MQYKFARPIILIVLAVAAAPHLAHGSIIGFGNFSGFTLNQSDSGAAPAVSPGSIRLTSLSFQQGRSIFHNTPQNISQFTASFTYQALNGSRSTPANFGAALVFQNDAAGPHAIGLVGLGGGLAYQVIDNSAAVSIELSALGVSKSGLYTAGVVSGGSGVMGAVDLYSGHPIHVTLDYDGSILQTNFLDTVTSNSFGTSYLVNLPTVVGSANAYVGFTASTAFGAAAEQYLSDFQYVTPIPEPASIILFVLTTCGMLGIGQRKKLAKAILSGAAAAKAVACGRS